MCKLCNSSICPPKCPNYREKGSKIKALHCVLCGDKILPDQSYYCANGFPYCEDCLRFSEAESLIRICENSFADGLLKLGFESRINSEWR